MKILFLFSLITSLILASKAYDLAEGLFALSDPCFEIIHDECCNSSLPEAFKPSYKGVDMNKPETQVYLFTKNNQDKAEPLHRCGGKLPHDTDFDPNAETVVIIHGLLDGMCRTAWMREMRNQFFIRGSYNVILVDWTWGNTFDAMVASLNALVLGEQIAFFLKNIMIEKNMNGDKFHLIGHSFGCFAASYAGKNIKKWKRGYKLRRITGLDPAVIPLGELPENREFSENDAKFVDVIHSNGGACFPFFFGNNQTMGRLDFYPNGGSLQTSCYSSAFQSIFKGDVISGFSCLLSPQLCFHLQSIQFFKVSINPPVGMYIGVHCNSYEDFQSGACKRCCKENDSDCAVAGMDAEKHFKPSKRRGTYFFKTHNYCPFPEDYDFSSCKDCKNKNCCVEKFKASK